MRISGAPPRRNRPITIACTISTRRFISAWSSREPAHACVTARGGEASAERYIRTVHQLARRRHPPSVDEHDVIIRAIRDGDARERSTRLQTNWRHAAERLGRVIEVAGDAAVGRSTSADIRGQTSDVSRQKRQRLARPKSLTPDT